MVAKRFGECSHTVNGLAHNYHHAVFEDDLLQFPEDIPIVSWLEFGLRRQALQLQEGVSAFCPFFGGKTSPELLVQARQDLLGLGILKGQIVRILQGEDP